MTTTKKNIEISDRANEKNTLTMNELQSRGHHPSPVDRFHFATYWTERIIIVGKKKFISITRMHLIDLSSEKMSCSRFTGSRQESFKLIGSIKRVECHWIRCQLHWKWRRFLFHFL
jgi:hypothetical protein